MNKHIENLFSTLLSNGTPSTSPNNNIHRENPSPLRETLPYSTTNCYSSNAELSKYFQDVLMKLLKAKEHDTKILGNNQIKLPEVYYDDLVRILKSRGFNDVKILNPNEFQFTYPLSLQLPISGFDTKRPTTASSIQAPLPIPTQTSTATATSTGTQSLALKLAQTPISVASNLSSPQSESSIDIPRYVLVLMQSPSAPTSALAPMQPFSQTQTLGQISAAKPVSISTTFQNQTQNHFPAEVQVSQFFAQPQPQSQSQPQPHPQPQQISQLHVNHRKSKRPRSTDQNQNNLNGNANGNGNGNGNEFGFGSVVSTEVKSESRSGNGIGNQIPGFTTATSINDCTTNSFQQQPQQQKQPRHKSSKDVFFRIYKSSNSDLPGIPIQIWKDEVSNHFLISFLAPGFSKDECSIRMIECANSKKSVWRFAISCEKRNCINKDNNINNNNNSVTNATATVTTTTTTTTTNDINPQENKTMSMLMPMPILPAGPIAELPFTSKSVNVSTSGLSELPNFQSIHLGFSTPQKLYQAFDLEVNLDRERNVGCWAPINGKFTFYIPYSPPVNPSFINIEYVN